MKKIFLTILVIALFLISGCSGTTDSLIPEDLTQEQQKALERIDPNGLMNPEIFNLTEEDVLQIDGIKTTISPPYQPIQEYYGVKEGRIWYTSQAGGYNKGKLVSVMYFINIADEETRLQKCTEIINDIKTILGEPDNVTLGDQDYSNQTVALEDMYALVNKEDHQKILYQWESGNEILYMESSINSRVTSILVNYRLKDII